VPPTLTAKLRWRYSSVTDAHQVDDRRGVEHGVDAVDGRCNSVLVADVALKYLEPGVRGQRRGRAVERAHVMAPLEQFRHQVGPDEAGATGDQHTAKISRQRCITHAGEHN
jgi:hypothetical protein